MSNVIITKQRGLTLVELMISVVLSLLLLAGVMVLFSGNKTSYRMQEGMSTVQETGRYGLSAMKRDINAAGFGGCITASQEPVLIAGDPVLPFVQAYRDGELVAGENDVSGRTIEGHAVTTGTDILQVRGPLDSSVFYLTQRAAPAPALQVSGNASAFAVGDYLIVSDCAHTEIFKASSVTASATAPVTTAIGHASSQNKRGGLFQTTMGEDSIVARLSTHTYFVAESSWTSASGATVQSLYRATGDGSPDELLQGVEDLQVFYGIDSDGDQDVDSFLDAGSVTDWSQVASVRVSMLVNSVEDAADSLASYRFSPASSTSITPTNSADRLMRQEFTASLTARNNLF